MIVQIILKAIQR